MEFPAEPFRIKVVERIKRTTREEREQKIAEAGYNVFAIPAEDIFIDLLTDSGTSAMSDNQWAGIMHGDESYAGGRNFFHLQDVVRKIFGYEHFIPTHQGRVAENLLFSTLLKPGKVVPNNIHFDTTRANVQANGGLALDCAARVAYCPDEIHPFKGNMDLALLEKAILDHGVENIPVVLLTITNNSGGGQPVSMQNVREVSALLKKHGIPLFFDACRFAENCWFIKQREPGFQDKSVLEIAQELFSYGDGCTMSAKKDGMVNIGGFIVLRSDEWMDAARNVLIMTEGFPTYGGLAGRDLEALAVGLEEGMQEDYLRYRLRTAEYLGERLEASGVGFVKPTGGHAVYIDAKTVLPDMPIEQYPAWALCNALYLEGGIRGVEIGSVMFGKRLPDGVETYHSMELVRLAFPRRMYTQSHFDYAAEVIDEVKQKAASIRGVKITKQPQFLRHFTAEFAWAGV